MEQLQGDDKLLEIHEGADSKPEQPLGVLGVPQTKNPIKHHKSREQRDIRILREFL